MPGALRCAATLTCVTRGGLGPGPAHQVGLSNRGLRCIHFPPEPPDPHCVVVGTGSNLPAEPGGGLYRNQIRGAQLHSGGRGAICMTQQVFEEITAGRNCSGLERKKSLQPHLGEISGTPGDGRDLLAVTLQRHGGVRGLRNLEWGNEILSLINRRKIHLKKYIVADFLRAHLPHVRVMVARTAGQELVVRADGGLDVERGVLVATENCHCGGEEGRAASVNPRLHRERLLEKQKKAE